MNPAAPGQSEMDPPVAADPQAAEPGRRWGRGRRHAPEDAGPRAAADPRTWVMLGSGILAVVLLCLVSLLPLPYVLLGPGPVRDVLGTTDGTADGTPMIGIEGSDTYDTEGSLDMVTVSVSGGPGSSARLWSVLLGWASPSVAVRPLAEQFPPDLTEEQIDEENAVSMVSSQESATAAALTQLDIAYATTLTVQDFTEGTEAATVLQEGDVLTAVDGTTVPDVPQLRAELQRTTPGDPVTVTVRRDGEPVDVDVTTGEGEDGGTVLGVLLQPAYEFPFDVTVEIENIGGPSAGMMFSLGIVDLLTPGAMTGGEQVAGTGTIDAAGAVGPIGGIRQKLFGAERAGAQWFLAPTQNCDEVVGHVPASLEVVSVSTLEEARRAVETIASGQGTGDLRGCGP